ncbi:Protein required for ethanol metabolism [Pleurotus ostreatus]|uniref:Uncharacterized protein n=2 Tax=Pleurotus ostreatus TaxID=5322 RepID=A0A067P525_PLEO1|nr:Protein required for ethanol metabolism [Pleurotus ostreatus]KAF7436613.1 Protein required for ethanol metabolism [Pleurotus ostreatus]KAJ8702365.1 Protein required for ethanol metabolism [Pleurotus ostreatus]KDQ30991.1 hypothetical protein PLEOSDRAFT_175749 [Pleurotus ostreatus PC15]
MASLLRAYNSALIRRPMLAQCLTGGILFGAGDFIAQQAVERRGLSDHDLSRTARLTFYGGCLFGPTLTKWYQFLGRIQFASPTKAVIYRVWLDQALLTPASIPFFFGAMSILEGKPHDAIPRITSAYVPTLLRNWCVFLPTQIINFWLVPPHLRFVVVSVVGLFWNTYLSIANREHSRQHVEANPTVLPVVDEKDAVP